MFDINACTAHVFIELLCKNPIIVVYELSINIVERLFHVGPRSSLIFKRANIFHTRTPITLIDEIFNYYGLFSEFCRIKFRLSTVKEVTCSDSLNLITLLSFPCIL